MKRVIPTYQNLVDVLQDAVDKERDAEFFYREAAEMATDPEIRDFLLNLSRMEAEHHAMLVRRVEMLKADQKAVDGIMSSFDEPPADGVE